MSNSLGLGSDWKSDGRHGFTWPTTLVAPTGFDHDATVFELEFEGLALAA